MFLLLQAKRASLLLIYASKHLSVSEVTTGSHFRFFARTLITPNCFLLSQFSLGKREVSYLWSRCVCCVKVINFPRKKLLRVSLV